MESIHSSLFLSSLISRTEGLRQLFPKCTYKCENVLEVLLLERLEGSKIGEAREGIEILRHRRKEGPASSGDSIISWRGWLPAEYMVSGAMGGT